MIYTRAPDRRDKRARQTPLPGQPARPKQKSVGGVMDLKMIVFAGHVEIPALPDPWASGGHWDGLRCETGAITEWALVSWLITADSQLSLPPAPPPHPPHLLCLPCITSLPALSGRSPEEKILLMTEEGCPIYLWAKPLRVSSARVPADRRFPKRNKKRRRRK